MSTCSLTSSRTFLPLGYVSFLKFFKSFKKLFNNQNNSRDIERGGSRFYRDWNLQSVEVFLRKKKYTIMSTKFETEMDAY